MIIFKTKEKVNFSPIGSTRKYFDYLKVKFTGINVDLNNQQIARVRGQWFWQDEQGEHHKVNDLKFAKSGVHIKQTEWQMGKLDVANLYIYMETRIAQMFPFILDEEKNQDPNANFGLGGQDVEIYVEPIETIEENEEL